MKIKKGTIQDATFITADPGHASEDKPRGELARTRRSIDGPWTKKNAKSYFGFKIHSKSKIWKYLPFKWFDYLTGGKNHIVVVGHFQNNFDQFMLETVF